MVLRQSSCSGKQSRKDLKYVEAVVPVVVREQMRAAAAEMGFVGDLRWAKSLEEPWGLLEGLCPTFVERMPTRKKRS